MPTEITLQAVLLEEPWARFVSTLDLGGPGGTIHPARKLEIGRRAAAELLEVEARVAGLSAASLPSVAVSADTLGPMLHPMQPPVVRGRSPASCFSLEISCPIRFIFYFVVGVFPIAEVQR